MKSMTPSLHFRVAKWLGTAAGVCGATLIALNLGAVGYGFALFLISSLLWCAVGFAQREPSLVVLQTAFTAINIVGLWRWTMA
jgi:nicotinamide riboside transporter PnuC